MQKQLSFWPIRKKTSQTLEIWQSLDREQQNQVIMALSHLIQKIVCPKEEKQTGGVNYEHQ